jgi:hypothetical protein
MKYLVLTHKTLVLAILLCVPGSWQAVYADERDIEESLRRLEWLVQAQQKELQAQRKELVEQRALIQHLQQEQAKESEDAEKTPAVEPAADVASTDQGKAPALPDGTQSQADNTQQPSTTIDTVVPATSDDDKESGQQAAIAELAKREREGTADADDEQDSVWLDDPSNTLYDPDFLGAWHLPGTTAAMKIGGYVNLAIVSSLDPLLSTDRFIVGTIPPQGQDVPGAKSGTAVTAGQSRLNNEVRAQTW